MLDDHASPSDRPIDEAIDEAEIESFPASDPQSSWAGPDPVAPAPESTAQESGATPTDTGGDGSSSQDHTGGVMGRRP
jgi:hypothetical protein